MSDPQAALSPTAALEAAAAVLAGADRADAAVEQLAELVIRATGAIVVAAYAQDPDGLELELVAGAGLADAELAGHALEVLDQVHPVATAAADRVAAFDRPDTIAGQAVSATDLPLVVMRDGIELALGALAIGFPEGRTTSEEDRALLAAFADLVAVAADRGRLDSMTSERSEWFERMANTDPLTGLANPRLLSRILELELARADRQGTEVSVAIFDIDAFEALNEEAGRAVGDDVLRRVAAVVAESVRLVDTVARFGGDEFIVVAPGSAGATVARRVLDGVAALGEIGGRLVTVSAGVARSPVDGADAGELVDAALLALRNAGGGSGNAISEASPAGDEAPAGEGAPTG
jgi:diguanylate cyclase (GGDEF)-like protein